MNKKKIIRALKHIINLCEISRKSDKDSLEELNDELEDVQLVIFNFVREVKWATK